MRLHLSNKGTNRPLIAQLSARREAQSSVTGRVSIFKMMDVSRHRSFDHLVSAAGAPALLPFVPPT
jgi:hypothetical protein